MIRLSVPNAPTSKFVQFAAVKSRMFWTVWNVKVTEPVTLAETRNDR